MPSINEICDYRPELLDVVMADLTEQAEREVTERIINAFVDAGLPVKVRNIIQKSGNNYYRVMCYIRKGTEAVLINTRNDTGSKGIFNGLNIQIRISERSVFEKLDCLPANVRDTFIAAADCVSCTPKCEGKKYVFTYGGKDYKKCQYLCANFRFRVKCYADVDGILWLVNNEISARRNKK